MLRQLLGPGVKICINSATATTKGFSNGSPLMKYIFFSFFFFYVQHNFCSPFSSRLVPCTEAFINYLSPRRDSLEQITCIRSVEWITCAILGALVLSHWSPVDVTEFVPPIYTPLPSSTIIFPISIYIHTH